MNAIAGRIASDATYQATQMVNAEEKSCLQCDLPKPLSQYDHSGRRKDGSVKYRPVCRACRSIERKADLERQRDRADSLVNQIELNRIWVASNGETII